MTGRPTVQAHDLGADVVASPIAASTDGPECAGAGGERSGLRTTRRKVYRGGGAVSWRIHVGDCRDLLGRIKECRTRQVDLVFADPPFNWNRRYDQWNDRMPDQEYCDPDDAGRAVGQSRSFTGQWLDLCVESLAPHGSMWVNIPDTWAAEIVLHLKSRGLHMVNWCVWHYRFGQNTRTRFINSKVHALYFCRDPSNRRWNADQVLEVSDRRSTYADPRTESKRDGMPAGRRVPLDVWYGQYWGRIQGNNAERRHSHDNQLPEVYLERVIRACSDEGDLVLDPFTGSGTTGVVAHAWGRRFIGTEYSEAMAVSATERIRSGMVRKNALSDLSSAIFPARGVKNKATPR